jgi:LuxR family transcriptional regulator, maltose regulon positive regulatory protein
MRRPHGRGKIGRNVVLAAKFAFPPEPTAFVRRDRLWDELDRAVERPLTLVAGPPGAGKTALLGSWIAAGRAPGCVAWLSLDAADGDRRRFWHAVFEALERAGAGTGETAPAVHPEERVDVLVARLASAVGEHGPVVLVLDDFHEVADTLHGDLDLLLRHPLPALRLIVATRADPPLHLGRLRLQDQLAEIRSPDLAFTLAETAAMLDALGITLAVEHRRRLWERTEGWVGAIRLASLSLREDPQPERRVDDFAGDDRAISDYLLTEVMSTLSDQDRSFMLRTAVAGVLNGDLADELTGGSDGHRRLGELARGGALLEPVDRRGEWYRYHALFAELLRAELRSAFPGELADLHRRAAVWLADHGDDAPALRHAVEAGAWDLATRLAGERWIDLLIRGEIGVLSPLVDRMPADRLDADPELALAVASAMLERGDEVAAERRLRRAEREALAAVRLHLARLRGDLEAALLAGRELARAGRLEPGVVETDLRALALTNLGIAELWSGDLDAAGRYLEHGRGAAVEAGRGWLTLVAVAHLAILAGAQDDFPRSARLAGEAIALAEAHGWTRSWPAGGAYLAQAAAELIGGRLEAAEPVLALAQEALVNTRERPLRAVLGLLRSGVMGAHGDHESALAVVVAGADALGDWPLRPSIRDQFAVREATLRAEMGDRALAEQLLVGGRNSLPAAVLLARMRLADGDYEAARATLAPWMGELDSQRALASVQALVVDALALDAQADHVGAAASLEQALSRAEPIGLRASLLAFGRPLQPLLRRQLRHGTAHGALATDLADALDHDGGAAAPRADVLVEQLSPRERAVLRYLPTMMSNQEIAAELFVSVNTVKTHLKAIYRKLDVRDRREAVRRARTLKLLSP